MWKVKFWWRDQRNGYCLLVYLLFQTRDTWQKGCLEFRGTVFTPSKCYSVLKTLRSFVRISIEGKINSDCLQIAVLLEENLAVSLFKRSCRVVPSDWLFLGLDFSRERNNQSETPHRSRKSYWRHQHGMLFQILRNTPSNSKIVEEFIAFRCSLIFLCCVHSIRCPTIWKLNMLLQDGFFTLHTITNSTGIFVEYLISKGYITTLWYIQTSYFE